MAIIIKETDGKYITDQECHGGVIEVKEHETKEDADGYVAICNFLYY